MIGLVDHPSIDGLDEQTHSDLQQFVALHRDALAVRHGIYLIGSVALGDFRAGLSDVDYVVICESSPCGEQLSALARQLPRRTTFDGFYVTPETVSSNRACPYVNTRRMRGYHPLTAVARWTLAHHPVRLTGERLSVSPPSGSELLDEMQFNLVRYWRPRLRTPLRCAVPRALDFTVGTLARIVHTMETGTVVSKTRALEPGSVARRRLGELPALDDVLAARRAGSLVSWPKALSGAIRVQRWARRAVTKLSADRRPHAGHETRG